MTKVVVQSAVGKSFSFSDSKLKFTHSQNEPTKIVGDYNDLDENTILFNDKMAVDSEGSSQNTICGSNVYDSEMTDTQMTVENSEDSSSHSVQKDIISKGFKYVSTKTTVINRTYNLFSPSSVSCVKATPSVAKNQINHESLVNNDTDKSRVVVQILTSDAKNSLKSQTITETKSAQVENQTTHSFRDDVFKILSTPQSANFKLGLNNHEEKQNTQQGKEISCKPNTSHFLQAKSTKTRGYRRKSTSFSSSDLIPTNAENSTQMVRSRRKRSLKSYFLFGRGPKISDIKHVPLCLQTATRNALRIVHYVLYDKYGLCSGEQQLLQTRKNILNFCGYPFSQQSPEFLKRANCLQKIPLPILFEVHAAIFGKTNVSSRMTMVQQLMQFFLKPKRYYKIVNKVEHSGKFMDEEEYHTLKEAALKGPLPKVPLKKLEVDDIARINDVIKAERESEHLKANVENGSAMEHDEFGSKPSSNYSSPAYILKGPGMKLKSFPSILRNVKKANEKNINLLHYILYGRVESKSVEMSRRNILEFSGFLKCQTHFIDEREATLIRLDKTELLELCEILCLCAKTSSKTRRVQKILTYLKKPVNPVKGRRLKPKLGFNSSSELKNSIPDSTHVKESADSFLDDTEEMENVGSSQRLQDFKQIRSNIECSVPSDLVELNDLLFMKPCDETEIHEKILHFSGFHFPTGSFHYHYRKTLMFYMGPNIVRKIAKLLDIEVGEQISSHDELSSNILNFLMGKKFQKSIHPTSTLGSSIKNSFDEGQESQMKNLHESLVVKQQTKSPITCHKSPVFIHKLSKATVEEGLSSTNNHHQLEPIDVVEGDNQSVSSTNNHQLEPIDVVERDNQSVLPNMENGEDTMMYSEDCSDDSTPLRDFIHHPTDQELSELISDIIKRNLFNITMGGLVQKVYKHYSQFNLSYRENFIKSEARQVLTDLRRKAVTVVQHQFNISQKI